MMNRLSLAYLPALSRLLFPLFILLCFSFKANSQTVTGKVVDAEGKPITPVSVVIKGSTIGTTTNPAGQFSIQAPSTAVLVFSSVGFELQEQIVSGRAVVDVILEKKAKSLDEVVVTALGIGKQSRSLGYATTSVKPDELTVNRTVNVMNALQGKVAGVNISALGTGPAGTSKIRIRGQSSITGQNNPLIVINGIPVDNTNFGTNPTGGTANADASIAVRGGGNTSDGGDGLSSIN